MGWDWDKRALGFEKLTQLKWIKYIECEITQNKPIYKDQLKILICSQVKMDIKVCYISQIIIHKKWMKIKN